MSTSSSLSASSTDNQCVRLPAGAKASRSFSELRGGPASELAPRRNPSRPDARDSERALTGGSPFARRHTGQGPGAAGRTLPDPEAGKLKRWRHEARRASSANSDGYHEEAEMARDFYEEVDDRMSHNSLEYPGQQARYIDRWLAESRGRRRDCSVRSRSFERAGEEFESADSAPYARGNVVGIRGFSSDSYIDEEGGGRQRLLEQNYTKLRRDYKQLLADYQRLKCRLEGGAQSVDGPGPARKRETLELEALKAVLLQQEEHRLASNAGGQHKWRRGARNVCDACRQAESAPPDGGPADGQAREQRDNRQGPAAASRLEAPLAQGERDHERLVGELRADNQQLRAQLGARDAELDRLRGELGNLSLEPLSRKCRGLQQENARLREAQERDRNERDSLRANYDQLEARLKLLAGDQAAAGAESHDELNRTLVELCRLQVYQPKLEMILETERKIKLELQAQVERLQEDNRHQVQRLTAAERELHQEKLLARASDSAELDKCRNELSAWRQRCQRLNEEKVSLEEALRANKARFEQLETRLRNQLECAADSCRLQLDRAAEDTKRLEAERLALVAQLDEESQRARRCEMERDKLNAELLRLHHELARVAGTQERPTAMETLASQLEQCEKRSLLLEGQLGAAETKNGQLLAELKLARHEADQLRRQLAEQKRRFAFQQRACDELRARKDKELARLRVDLNYEQYNRQISLRGIEKELRWSLKELESMKSRFSKRLGARSGPADCESPAPLSAGHDRVVQFEEQPPPPPAPANNANDAGQAVRATKEWRAGRAAASEGGLDDDAAEGAPTRAG